MSSRSKLVLVFVLAAAASVFAAPASALDGEVLIDQAKAQAGGITPGDDPGFPVTLSQRGKYKLAGNLSVPAGKNGITVTANFVTIDLNGFRIFGADRANVGINAVNRDGLTVMNGTIAKFKSDGITARGLAIIQDMQVTNNGGNGLTLDNNARVIRSTISGNANGILCFSGCLVAHNTITGSTLDTGVNLQTTAGGHLVLDNVIAGNKKFGIYVEGPAGFANNTLTGNNNGGAQVLGTDLHAVHPNYCEPACP